ncbi:MAG TPA: hypothetical protein PK674_02880 [Candidatus Absconditabacterales bacterium]|nr:hypothetical protein [Candidatus Absconditabacterales bacterium]HOQ79191.1 hypothetical protein [Candidatus Absconditabacterales bacterium]
MKNSLNRLGNTVAIPIRLGGTIVTTSADLFTTLTTSLKEGCEIVANTSQEIKNVLLGAWNHGKWYHKALNVPLSPIVAIGTAFEGIVRSAVQPVISGIVNTWNTGINTIKNARKGSFGRLFSKKPLSDFSYNHLKTRPLTLNNWFAKLQFARGKSEGGESKGAVAVLPDKKKSEKKQEGESSEEKVEKKLEKTKEEKKFEKVEEKKSKEKNKEEVREKNKEELDKEAGYKQAEEILKDSKHGSKIYKKIRYNYPGLAFIFDKNLSSGEIKGDENKIIVGTKLPSDEKQIAPLNDKKDNKEQIKHVLLHEMSHMIIDNNLGKVERVLDISKNVFERKQTTLTPLAQLGIYKTPISKAKEDLSEMMALYANGKLDEYLGKLTSDKKEDEEYREKFKLAKISNDDAKVIKNTCEKLVSEL